MKDFMKYTLATMVGLILTGIIATVLSIISLAGMMASEGVSAGVEDHSILRIRLEGELTERAEEENPLDMLGISPMGLLAPGQSQAIGLDKTLLALKKAAGSDKIEGVYLEGGLLSATPASLQELRRALLEFKKSGKWVVAYGDTYSRSAYYLCSAADTVCLNPAGMLDWSGLSTEIMFYTGLMEKLGIRMQVYKVGTYKSAVEPYVSKEMSEANRQQIRSYLGGIWGDMQADVARSRHLTVGALGAVADSATSFCDARAYLRMGLVDKLCYLSDVKDDLKQRMGLGASEELTFTDIESAAAIEVLDNKSSNEVAVYYAYGEIVDNAEAGLATDHAIVCDKMMQDLQALRQDEDVKAVVIRVNSPGGSAYASEQIWHEVQLLRAEKPVVISMGGLAASGGYYISCGADKIWAEPMTLTGSIGIFGMVPDASGLLREKLGLTFDVVKTNAMSDFGALGRPFSAEEGAMMQAYVNRGYDLFTRRVASGRSLTQDSVKAIAEGRVWTGRQALGLGLVDALGNLDDAVRDAAARAKLKQYTVGRYPDEEPWYMTLLNEKTDSYLDSHIRSAMGESYAAYAVMRRISHMNPVQARLPYGFNIK